MKSVISGLKWHRIILASFLLGGTFGTVNLSATLTSTEAMTPFCPAPSHCRTDCRQGTKQGYLCFTDCGSFKNHQTAMKVLYLPVIILLTISHTNPLIAQQDDESMLWAARTEAVTNDILKDIENSSSSQRPLPYARLGEKWWEKDEQKGRFWLEKSVEYAVSPATAFANKKEKLKTLRDLLRIVAPKHSGLEVKILKALNEISAEMDKDDVDDNSEAILQTALAMVDVDVQRAFNLAVLTLAGQNPIFSLTSVRLFVKMQARNETLANQYYSLALRAAASNGSQDFFDNLSRLAFPDSSDSPRPFLRDDRLRRELLILLSDHIKIEVQELLEKKRTDCNLTVQFGQRFLSSYQSIAPDRLAGINQAINICQVALPKDDPSSPGETPKTIDEFLSAAEKTDDKKLKSKFLLNAAMLAERQKQYNRTLDILFKIDEDMRNEPFGVWEATLLFAAMPLIIEHIENDNLAETYATFKRIPDVTRTLVRIGVVNKLDEKNQRIIAREILDEARKELAKIEFKPVGKDVRVLLASPAISIDVVRLYSRFGFHEQAIDTFDESIKTLNGFIAQVSSDEKDREVIGQPVRWSRYGEIDGPFFEAYFQRINDTISQIAFRPIRFDARFQWLKISLTKQTEVEKEAIAKKQKAATKTATNR